MKNCAYYRLKFRLHDVLKNFLILLVITDSLSFVVRVNFFPKNCGILSGYNQLSYYGEVKLINQRPFLQFSFAEKSSWLKHSEPPKMIYLTKDILKS